MKEKAIQWLWRVTGRKKLYVGALMLVQALYGGSGVVYALLLRDIVDSAVAGENAQFWNCILLIVLLVLGQVMLRAIVRFLEEQSRATLENLFKVRLLDKILYRDFASVSAVHSGEWLNRLTNDCMVVANHFTEILPGIAGMFVKLVSAAVMITALEPKFAGILLPAGIVLLFLTYAFRKKLKQMHKQIQEQDGSLRIFLQEHLGSLMMIRSYAAEKRTAEEAEYKMHLHKSARMKKNHFSNLCNIGFHSGMQGMYLLGVCYCGYGILTGSISYGTLTAVTQLISQIQSPFANITGYLPKFYAMTASAERLMEIETFPEDCNIPSKNIQEIQQFYQQSFSGIAMKDVHFTYYPASEKVGNLDKSTMPVVLKQISLTVQKGEYTAFTGHSGCGKSTILKLLMCIYKPDSGERIVLDTSGNTFPLDASWHRLFAYVPQGNQLMSGTLREIVTFADKSGLQDDVRIRNALKIACADEFVSQLENGIDTILGERGTGLSEGQMQRIAVARAVFSESPVLILDEATSALDETTEKRMLHNLRQMTDKTVIIVTHRPAALEICDTVLQITENGILKLEVS